MGEKCGNITHLVKIKDWTSELENNLFGVWLFKPCNYLYNQKHNFELACGFRQTKQLSLQLPSMQDYEIICLIHLEINAILDFFLMILDEK